MKNKNQHYNIDDILSSYKWLGHAKDEFTELTAFHKNYKAGRENFQYNLENRLLPKIWYVSSEKQLLDFVRRYYKDHTCCYGINPRPSILKNKNRNRSARDKDIERVMSFYLDFDFEGERKNFPVLKELLGDIQFYLSKEGISKPVWAYTGNGYHLLFAFPSISIKEQPDTGQKIKKFRDIISYEFGGSMKSEGIKLDSTADLRRVAKIYGTKKPYENARLSRFYGNERIEDKVLGEYLLSLELNGKSNDISFEIPEELPQSFLELLAHDSFIKKLWNNEGKEKSDCSRTGYDFTLTKECIKKGITDIRELSSILKLRPDGAYRNSNKDELYIRRTIGNALYK